MATYFDPSEQEAQLGLALEQQRLVAQTKSAAEGKPVKHAFLDVVKSSGGAPASLQMVVEVSAPMLKPPLEFEELAHERLAQQLTKMPQSNIKSSIEQEYDEQFIAAQGKYASEMMRKGKFLNQMRRRNFKQQILFAYTHPDQKGLDRAAKKFAFQACKRALREVSEKKREYSKKLADNHRQELKKLIDNFSSLSFEAKFAKLSSVLPEMEREALRSALQNPALQSYLSKGLKESFYALEKEAGMETKENYGAPSAYELAADRERYEAEQLTAREDLYQRELGKLPVPLQMKKVMESLFYRPEMVELYPQAESLFKQVLAAVDEKMLQRMFGPQQEGEPANKVKRLHLFQDHLFFLDAYKESLNDCRPPLESEEKEALLRYVSQQSKALPSAFKAIHERTFQEAKQQTINQFSLSSAWSPDGRTMAEAVQFMHLAEEAAACLKLPQDAAEQLMKGIIDRSYFASFPNLQSLSKQAEELIERALDEFKKLAGASLREIRESGDTICFTVELEKELGGLSTAEMKEALGSLGNVKGKSKEEIEFIVKTIIAQVKRDRGLPQDWLPNAQLAEEAVSVKRALLEKKKLHAAYFGELLQTTEQLTLELVPSGSKYAISTGEFARMMPRLYALAQETIYEEIAANATAFKAINSARIKAMELMNLKQREELSDQKGDLLGIFQNIYNNIAMVAQMAINPFHAQMSFSLGADGKSAWEQAEAFTGKIQVLLDAILPEGIFGEIASKIAFVMAYAAGTITITTTPGWTWNLLNKKVPELMGEALYPMTGGSEQAKRIAIAVTQLMIAVLILIIVIVITVLTAGAAAPATVGVGSRAAATAAIASETIMTEQEATQRMFDAILPTLEQSMIQGLNRMYNLSQEMMEAATESVTKSLQNLSRLMKVSRLDPPVTEGLKETFNALTQNWKALADVTMGTAHIGGSGIQIAEGVRTNEIAQIKAGLEAEVFNIEACEEVMKLTAIHLGEDIVRLAADLAILGKQQNLFWSNLSPSISDSNMQVISNG